MALNGPPIVDIPEGAGRSRCGGRCAACCLARFLGSLLILSVGSVMGIAAAAMAVEWEPDLRLLYEGRAAYPRVVELADGTLLATFDHPTATGRAIGSTRSTNGGRTWEEYQRVWEEPGPVDLANAFPLQLPDGTILVALRHHRPEQRRYRLEVYASEDQGYHWALRSVLAEGTTGLWEPFLMLLPDGTLQAYYASEEGCYPDQTIEMRSSPDQGHTWGTPLTVASKARSRDGMPAVVRLAAGELLVVFEAQDLPPYRFVLRAVRSRDGGASWSEERELVYRPANPARRPWSAGAPSAVVTAQSRIMVGFQTDEQVRYQPDDPRQDPAAPAYNYLRHTSFAFVTSDDHAETWNPAVHLVGSPEQPACWNALYLLESGRILALTTYQGRVWCKIGCPN